MLIMNMYDINANYFLDVYIKMQTYIWIGIMHLLTHVILFCHDSTTFYALEDKQFFTFDFFHKNNNLQIVSRLKRIQRNKKKNIVFLDASYCISSSSSSCMVYKNDGTHGTLLNVFLTVALLNPCVAVYHSYLQSCKYFIFVAGL